MSGIFGRIGGQREDEEDANAAISLAPTGRGARWVRRHMAGPVVAVTTSFRGRFAGATVSACIVTSVDPLQLLISVEVDSQLERWLRDSGAFAVNVLPYGEQLVADRFAGLAPHVSPTFSEVPHTVGETGSPILNGSIAWADCTVTSFHQTGDHVCIVGEAIAVGRGAGDPEDPLLYYLSRYRHLR